MLEVRDLRMTPRLLHLPAMTQIRTPVWNLGLMSYDSVIAEMRKVAPRITVEQTQTFIAVACCGRCSQTEIGTITGFTRQATSRHVAKLVRAGLLAQRQDLENRRRQIVRLTALGRLVPASLEASQRERGRLLLRDVRAIVGEGL